MTFHQKLSRLVIDRNKSAIARRAGIPIQTFGGYLCKKQMPAADNAYRLAVALGVDLHWLLNDRKGWPPVWLTEGHEPIAGLTAVA